MAGETLENYEEESVTNSFQPADLQKVPDFLGTWPSHKIFSLKMRDFSTFKIATNCVKS